jgi:hypothetical protein
VVSDAERKAKARETGRGSLDKITGNIRMLSRLRYEVAKLWRRWLGRLGRRNRGGPLNWERLQGMLRTSISILPLIAPGSRIFPHLRAAQGDRVLPS